MRLQKTIGVLLCLTALVACTSKKNKTETSPKKEISSKAIPLSKAELLAQKTIEAHGGELYETAHFSFDFRENSYQFKNDFNNYEYIKTSNKEKIVTQDLLKNGQLTRTLNNEVIDLNDKELKSATGAINSVIYFATLPHKLKDASVLKTYIGTTTIHDKNYEILGITFQQEGGGEDFDDQFHYWINTETHKIDYLAYNYKVNGGGVRFRSAYNRRVVEGITFQDYSNYKAELGTPLKELGALYEAGKLKELSKIETANVVSLSDK
ncbi:DUF6503 family protein [Flavicella sediminum]|uniref:DUF6503 family protein n=1 Tax=Flavicella sediminum TaxID=2585141 RepID=UPI00111F1894|nr:DUF6503 family protein [Flavicella sediminum]